MGTSKSERKHGKKPQNVSEVVPKKTRKKKVVKSKVEKPEKSNVYYKIIQDHANYLPMIFDTERQAIDWMKDQIEKDKAKYAESHYQIAERRR